MPFTALGPPGSHPLMEKERCANSSGQPDPLDATSTALLRHHCDQTLVCGVTFFPSVTLSFGSSTLPPWTPVLPATYLALGPHALFTGPTLAPSRAAYCRAGLWPAPRTARQRVLTTRGARHLRSKRAGSVQAARDWRRRLEYP